MIQAEAIQPAYATRLRHNITGLGVFVCLPLLVVTGCANIPLGQYGLPVTELRIDHHVLRVEVAATAGARQRGLSHRGHMTLDGMLFVFATPRYPAFWMKDTQLPLSIAFIDAGGKIDSIQSMTPGTLSVHQPKKPVLYALEVLRGTFSRLGVKAGSRISGLANLPVGN